MWDNLEVVEADLLDYDSLLQATAGCSAVIHVASPIIHDRKIKDPEKELYEPAVDGTLNVMKACVENKVNRIVVTSSSVTVVDSKSHLLDEINEETFAKEENAMMAYQISKIRAEAAGREFVEEHPELEYISLHPGFIIGPPLMTETSSPSIGMISNIMKGKMFMMPDMSTGFIDVRDLALAHIKALDLEANQRILVECTWESILTIARYLRDEFNPLGWSIPVRRLNGFVSFFAKIFSSEFRRMSPMMG